MTGNGKGGCRDTSARAACRPVGHHVWIQEATNKGRREDKARPKDNDVKEMLGRRGRGDGESFRVVQSDEHRQQCHKLQRKRGRKSMTRNVLRKARREGS
jgi:hypothetical protein